MSSIIIVLPYLSLIFKSWFSISTLIEWESLVEELFLLVDVLLGSRSKLSEFLDCAVVFESETTFCSELVWDSNERSWRTLDLPSSLEDDRDKIPLTVVPSEMNVRSRGVEDTLGLPAPIPQSRLMFEGTSPGDCFKLSRLV